VNVERVSTIAGAAPVGQDTVAPSRPATVAAGDGTAEGSYENPRSGTPDIHANLSWTWQAPELAPCGDAGLIEDD